MQQLQIIFALLLIIYSSQTASQFLQQNNNNFPKYKIILASCLIFSIIDTLYNIINNKKRLISNMYLQCLLLPSKKDHLLPKITHNQTKKKKKTHVAYQQIYRVTAHDLLTNKSNDYNSTTFRKSVWKGILQKQSQGKKTLTKSVARTTTYIQSNPLKEIKPKATINGYKIIKQIGTGGFAKVYQAVHENQNSILSSIIEKKSYAVKQYSIDTAKQCYINEYNIGSTFFTENGNLKSKFENIEGSKYIIKFIEKFRFGKKCYIVQQLGGQNLSKIISDIQGIFYQNQRVYQINFKSFFTENLINKNQLASVFLQLCKGIQLLHSQGFIHCDLKSQNILVDTTNSDKPICKIIDFGSTFQLSEGVPKVTITPEYMPPQLLNYLHSDMLGNIVEQKQKTNCAFWNQNGFGKGNRLDRIDIWSLGCILLQIVTGVPLWFKYKCKIMIKGKPSLQLSYFSMSNRQYPKLMKRQKQLSRDIKKLNFIAHQFEKFRPILKRCLEYDPQSRINIDDLIKQVQKLL